MHNDYDQYNDHKLNHKHDHKFMHKRKYSRNRLNDEFKYNWCRR